MLHSNTTTHRDTCAYDISAPEPPATTATQHREPPEGCSMATPSATSPAKLHCSSGEASLQPRRSPFRPHRSSNDRAELQCTPGRRSMATPSTTSPAKLHCGSGESFIAALAESVTTPSQLQRPGGAPWQPRVALQCNLDGVKISSNTAPPLCGVAAPAASSARLQPSSCLATTAASSPTSLLRAALQHRRRVALASGLPAAMQQR